MENSGRHSLYLATLSVLIDLVALCVDFAQIQSDYGIALLLGLSGSAGRMANLDALFAKLEAIEGDSIESSTSSECASDSSGCDLHSLFK